MEEKVNYTALDQPEFKEESLLPEERDTTPPSGNTDSAFVEVKFNKETKKLTLDEAATLAQKGMKFDMISDEFARLKSLAETEGLTVKGYIDRLDSEMSARRRETLLEKCGGDTELADKLLKLESSDRPDEFSALTKEFPELTYDAVPDEVKTAAQLKGTGLLFEYLLYDHRLRVAAAEELSRREATAQTSLGSLSSGSSRSITDNEFLKGVWGK